MKTKRGFLFSIIALSIMLSFSLSTQALAEEVMGITLEKYLEQYKGVAIKDPAYIAQLENEKKQYGISARDIQVMNLYYMKFMQFKTWDVAFGRLPLLREDGQVRERVVTRQQMTMPPESGIEVKGNFNFLSPNEVKGMKALMITYYDPKKESDYWMYVPSLRKIRRISAADRDDSFFGSDCTWADAADIKVDEEKHRILREAPYPTQWDEKIYDEPGTAAWEHVFEPGCAGKVGADRDKCPGIEHKYPFKFPLDPGRKPKTDNLGPMCYVVESIPQWPTYYAKKVTWYHKDLKFSLCQDYYDEKGRHIKYFKRTYIKIGEQPGVPGPTWSQNWWFIKTLTTGHSTFHDVISQVANSPAIKEYQFTQSSMVGTGR
jgi:hypothetical protein